MQPLIAFLFKRMTRRPGLAALALLAIVLPVGVLNTIPLFAGAVDRAVLAEELMAFGRARHRPPFAIRMYTYGTPSTPLPLSLVEDALETVVGTVTSQVGLPATRAELHVYSINFSAETPQILDERVTSEKPEYLQFAYVPALADHIEIIRGDRYLPYGEPVESDAGEVNVWIRRELADRLNVRVGDEFTCRAAQRLDEEDPEKVAIDPTPLTVSVAGTWSPVDPDSDFWFDDPAFALAESMLISRVAYEEQVQPRQQVKIHRVNWDMVLDVRSADPGLASRYLAGLRRALQLVQQNIPGVLYDQAPIPPLEDYTTRDRVLTAQLLSFSIPGLGFLIFFLATSATIVAQGRRSDTATLLSRGVPVKRIMWLTGVEELVLAVVGLPLGLGLAMGLALGMGYTRSFLKFGGTSAYHLMMGDLSPSMSLVALGTSTAFRLLATYRQTEAPLAGERQARARPMHPPFWMRYGFDMLLVLPTAYLTQRLIDTGSLAALAPLRGEELYATPELVLVPALFLLTATLVATRGLPLLTGVLGWIAELIAAPAVLLAMRHLARRWQRYAVPVILIVLSLALGVYALSMALSLDQWLVDRTYYRVGADLAFSPFIEQQVAGYGVQAAGAPIGGSWIPPIEEFRQVPGVLDAARVGKYDVNVHGTDGRINGVLMAVDRTEFGDVAWFRDDLSPADLGSMMNRLARSPEAVLLPRSFLRRNLLEIGDRLPVSIALDRGMIVEDDMEIAGTYDLFPTVYPEDGPTLIGNLDYLTYLGGMTADHDIWAKTDGSVDGLTTFRAVSHTGVEAGFRMDTAALIAEARGRHERVGVFGTLSLGFITALLMAVFALFIYRQASLQERIHALAVLHAVGVSQGQLLQALLLEEILLLVYSVGTALGLGVLTSRIFVPLMRITEGAHSLLPPMIPIVVFDETRWLLAGFLLATLALDVGLIYRAFARTRAAKLRVFA
jgi:putative ABC transport system permease protein